LLSLHVISLCYFNGREPAKILRFHGLEVAKNGWNIMNMLKLYSKPKNSDSASSAVLQLHQYINICGIGFFIMLWNTIRYLDVQSRHKFMGIVLSRGYLSTYLSIYPSIYLSDHLSICRHGFLPVKLPSNIQPKRIIIIDDKPVIICWICPVVTGLYFIQRRKEIPVKQHFVKSIASHWPHPGEPHKKCIYV